MIDCTERQPAELRNGVLREGQDGILSKGQLSIAKGAQR